MKHSSKALSLIMLISLFMSSAGSAFAVFSDVSPDHTNYEAINYVQTEGIVSGYPDGSYKADITINRAEFTKIVITSNYNAVDIDGCIDQYVSPSMDTVFFPDVLKTEWYAKYICMAKMENIIQGYPDGNFKPSNEINFVEASKIITVVMGNEITAGDPWYKPYVEIMAAEKAIPISIESFDHNISRGEMAEMIYRLLADITTKASLTYADFEQAEAVCSTSTDMRDAIVKFLTAETDAEKRVCLTDWAKQYPEYLVPEVNLTDVQPNGNDDEIRGIDSHSAEIDVYYWYGTSTTPVTKIFIMDKSSGNWLIHAIISE